MSATYEQKSFELDKELAGLLGYTNIRQSKLFPEKFVGRYSSGDKGHIPRWTQDDAEAFRLAVEHDVLPSTNGKNISAPGVSTLYATDFPDKQSAARYAIVQAVINKLKG